MYCIRSVNAGRSIAVVGFCLAATSCLYATERWITHGPYGGTVSALIPSVDSAGGFYAGVRGHGVFRVSTGAERWEPRNDGLEDLRIRSLAQNPVDTGVLYAGTTLGVYWTTDGGGHWEARDGGLSPRSVDVLAIDPTDPRVIYSGGIWEGDWHVYKTTDAGETWLPTGPGIPLGIEIRDVLVDPADPQVVYVAAEDVYGYAPDDAGVYKSVDGGALWKPSGNGLLNQHVIALAFDPADNLTIYAGCYANEYLPFGGVYVSNDAGANWTRVSDGLPSTGEFIVNDLAVVRNPDDDTATLYAAGGYVVDYPRPPARWERHLYKSTDGGASWTLAATGIAYPNVLSIAVDPADPDVIYAGSDCGGVFRSRDAGATWSHFSTGLELLCVWDVAVHPLDDETLYAGVSSVDAPGCDYDAGMFVSFDGGLSWLPRNDGLYFQSSFHTSAVAVALCEEETILAPNRGWNLFKSTDEGLNWEWRGGPHGLGSFWLTDAAVDPRHQAVAYVSVAGFEPDYPDVYKTEDCGETWQAIASYLIWAEFNCVTVDPTDSQTIYAGSGWEGVWKTTDGGGTWVCTGEEILNTRVWDIVVDAQDQQTVFAADGDWNGTGVYVSDNGGDNWRLYNDGLEDLSVYALAHDVPPTSLANDYPPQLYAGTRTGGVYRRTADTPWAPINEALQAETVHSLALGSPGSAVYGRVLYAGTAAGVYRRITAGDLDGDGDVDLSDLATLLANYGTSAGPSYEDGDIDDDGDVDLTDLAALLGVYGTSCE
jgi:photosystem II stability/assembly factor-like uncharacterized protein